MKADPAPIRQSDDARQDSPRAVVGSQVSYEEEMFGALFDGVIVRRFWQFVRPYRGALALGIAGVLLFTITQLAIPLIVRHAIDEAVLAGEQSVFLLRLTVLAFLVAIAINYAANFVQEWVVGKIAGHLLFDLRRAMYQHLQFVALSFMDKTETGRLMSRLQGDVAALQEFLETSIFAIGDLVLLFGIVGVLLWLDTELGLLTLSVVPILLLVRVVWLPHARKAFLRARETASAVNGALAENVHGIRTIQETGREQINYELFDVKANDNLNAHLRASQFSNVLVPIVDSLTGAAMAIVVVTGGTMVLDNKLDVGVMVAFLFYVQRFFDPIRSLTMQYSIMQRAMAAGQRIFEVLDVPVDVRDPAEPAELTRDEHDVEFVDVTFGYEPQLPVLRNVTFKVTGGETLALVGPTGSGKSSVIALAHRFYDVWSGSVRIGGKDVRDLRQQALGDQIAMVLQDPFLFTGTVHDNICYCQPGVSRDDVVKAAAAVGAHEFISSLAQGYDTELEQRGANLSIGQRQLISFARALVADTPILILDEATASIDSYTERKIQQALAVLLEGRTAIVIAHRLATIRGADRIVVLQSGEVVEQGTHASLLDDGGLYARMYRYNYASFDDMDTELNPVSPGAERERET